MARLPAIRISLAIILVAAFALAGASCSKSDSSGSGGGPANLRGAGATFPTLLYKAWFKAYHDMHDNVIIDYSSEGSGAGVTKFIEGSTDFGASDRAMTDEEMAKVKDGVVLLPMTAGSIVVAYNFPEIKDLKLSRAAYSGIFLGDIKKWNDPAIVASNPGVTLPDADIKVAHRSDGSGTSYVFTQHLSAINADWKKGPGTNQNPNWPAGIGGKGNEGVTALIKGGVGTIGYVEYGYAEQNKLATALLENKAGKFVKATPESGAAALATIEMPEDLRAWAPDPAGDDSYPIVSFTWFLCHGKYGDAAKGNALLDAINYGLTDGQKLSGKLGYIPLPDPVVVKVKAKARTIKVGS